MKKATECYRIVEQGILPSSFFCEETISEFLVNEKRKKVWAVEVDLLLQLDTVCRKHNLQYSLAVGSLLGVIRHHGFIPWDDDIDVFMPRADYELLKKYKSEFNGPYFLQYPGNDNEYAFSFAKLRNCNTTGISWSFRYASFNQGICIDIFPLDNYSSYRLNKNLEKISNLVAECSALMRRGNPYPDANDQIKLCRFPVIRDVGTIVKELDCILRQHEHEISDRYVVWSVLVYSIEKLTFDKALYDDLIETDFYGHSVFIPRRYDEVLTISYGDYMKLPPVEERGKWHDKCVFDPDTPYKVSLQLLRNQDKL